MAANGRIAVVSGGARGMGAAHVERMAREGVQVLAGDVLVDDGKALESRLRAGGFDVRFRPLDVTSQADWAGAIAGAEEMQGQAVFSVRSPETSAACPESLLRLPLDSEARRLLYSLLLSAHMGERLVSVWFDADDDCRITQGQIHE